MSQRWKAAGMNSRRFWRVGLCLGYRWVIRCPLVDGIEIAMQLEAA